MSTAVKLEFISDGFRQILNSEGVKSVVQSEAERIKAAADSGIIEESEGFSANVWTGNYGGGRWVGSVTTTDAASSMAESENKVLTKAVTG